MFLRWVGPLQEMVGRSIPLWVCTSAWENGCDSCAVVSKNCSYPNKALVWFGSREEGLGLWGIRGHGLESKNLLWRCKIGSSSLFPNISSLFPNILLALPDRLLLPKLVKFRSMSPCILSLTLFWSSGSVRGCRAVNSYFCLWKGPSAQLLEFYADFSLPSWLSGHQLSGLLTPSGPSSHIQRKGWDRSGFMILCEDEGGSRFELASSHCAPILPKMLMGNFAQQC